MPCGFPIKGPDLGFPGQGISCSEQEGEEEEREGHGCAAFLAFLAAAPSSCRAGAGGAGLVPRPAGPYKAAFHLGAPWIWGDKGTLLMFEPSIPGCCCCKKKKMYPNPVNKDFGLWRQSVSRRGVSVFSSTSWGSPAHPAPPEKLCRGTRDRAGRVEGPGFYQVSQYLGQSLPFWTLFPSAEWGASDALHCTLWIII
jgi:hypothetical protein